ncbi:hypothetical protein E2562_017026 [Oryza meyeriana var. granulata]|uniref:C2H2-type domain-containing protein n=1 Tax=Oryza meyeriana var. granulata TaxID=110450 RepID=A0A6G1ECV1_9ORYZ|nr:hypothetical protein E2562_017026 [Oryza meyeriana var. granulata]
MAPRPGIPLGRSGIEEIGGMAPAGRKHWCKLCSKSFPSYQSLGGHMNLHSTRRKKKPPMSPRKSPTTCVSGRFGFRERRQRQVALCLSDYTSSDDEPWTLPSKTECQLCFRVFHSCDALSMHMKAHAHHGRKMVMVEHKASRKLSALSSADGDNDFTAVSYAPAKKARSRRIRMDIFPTTPVMMTHGTEVVDAARILLMLSEDADKYSASQDGDLEMAGSLYHSLQKTEMELSSYRSGVIGDTELIKPENSSSDEEIKFCSLSDVLKANASHECRLCSKVFSSGSALGGHMGSHRPPAHENVATFHKIAVTPLRRQLLEVKNELHELNLPALSNRDSSSTTTGPELSPWLVTSSLRSERMMSVV